jgi:hypothetical protein
VWGEVEGHRSEAVALGVSLAERLLSQGADHILRELYAPE